MVTGNLTPTGIPSLDRSVHSVSLYRLTGPGPPIVRTLGQILLNNNIKEYRISGKRVKQQEKKNAKNVSSNRRRKMQKTCQATGEEKCKKRVKQQEKKNAKISFA